MIKWQFVYLNWCISCYPTSSKQAAKRWISTFASPSPSSPSSSPSQPSSWRGKTKPTAPETYTSARPGYTASEGKSNASETYRQLLIYLMKSELPTNRIKVLVDAYDESKLNCTKIINESNHFWLMNFRFVHTGNWPRWSIATSTLDDYCDRLFAAYHVPVAGWHYFAYGTAYRWHGYNYVFIVWIIILNNLTYFYSTSGKWTFDERIVRAKPFSSQPDWRYRFSKQPITIPAYSCEFPGKWSCFPLFVYLSTFSLLRYKQPMFTQIDRIMLDKCNPNVYCDWSILC